jgi:phenylacetic acid degradation operon negative regulatory protein
MVETMSTDGGMARPEAPDSDVAESTMLVASRLSSQRLLVTVLADYSFASAGEFPSAAIVDIMGEFGISSAGARIALSRVARSGMLVQTRNGRKTAYSLNEEGLVERESRLRRYLDFGESPTQWDGRWTVVVFSIPEANRDLRPRLRRELERLRFSPLTDAVWVQTDDHGEEVAAVGAELGVGLAVMRAEFRAPGPGGLNPVDAFDIDALRVLYDEYISAFGPWATRLRSGDISPANPLVLRANALASWRAIALEDPELPRELLPEDWPQAEARALFLELWEGLGEVALTRLRGIVGRHDVEAAARLRLRVR